jgi:excisionase family DNA binding protein
MPDRSMAPNKRTLRVTEAARVLSVSRMTIWRWIHCGRLEAVRVSERVTLVARESVQRLLLG